MLGINSMAVNAYQSEKNQISRSLEKISDFKKECRYYEEELKEREKEADSYLQDLPGLMSGMFDYLEASLDN